MYLYQEGRFPDITAICSSYIDVSESRVYGLPSNNVVPPKGILLTTPTSISDVDCWV